MGLGIVRFDADRLAIGGDRLVELALFLQRDAKVGVGLGIVRFRSEEHTSELQSQSNLVCRLLLEKKSEVDRIGLASYADIEDGCVFRVPKSYPVYDSAYRDYLATIREFVDGLENFQSIGRNRLHQ